MRCPSCSGLRTISYRNRDTAALCPDCRRGEIVRRETYWDWWLERFSAAECAAMARAIWGPTERRKGPGSPYGLPGPHAKEEPPQELFRGVTLADARA